MAQDNEWWKQGATAAKPEQPSGDWWAQGATHIDEAPIRSTARSVGDSAIALGTGVVQGVKMLTDVAGADNAASRALGSASDALTELESPYRKAQKQERAAKIQDAEATGSTWEEVKAHVGAFADAPLDTTLNALGTSVPTIAAGMLTGGGSAAAQVAARAAPVVLGVAQGVGNVKGQIHETVKQKHMAAGMPEAEATQRADAAQAYGGDNTGSIAVGGALGGLAGGTGVESSVRNLMGRKVASEAAERAAPGVIRSAVGGVLKEAPMEAAQGGQERLASNTALQGEGFDVPTWQGVAGQAALEGIAAAPMGGGFGAVEGLHAQAQPSQQKTDQVAATSEQPDAEPPPAAAPLALPAPVINVAPDGTAITAADRNARLSRIASGDVTDVTPIPAADPVREAVAAAAEQGGALSGAALTAIDSGAVQVVQPEQPTNEPRSISLEEADARDQAAYEQFFANHDSDPVVGRYFEDDTDIPDFGAASNVSDEEFLRSLGATDEDIQDAIATASQPAISQSSPAVDAGAQTNEPTGTGQGVGADQAAQGQVAATPAPSAPANLRDGLARVRAQKQEAANAKAATSEAAPAAQAVPAAGTGAVEAAGVARSKLLASLDQTGATREMVLNAKLKDAQDQLAQIVATTGILPADRASRISGINQDISSLNAVRDQARQLDERDRREGSTRSMLQGARQELDAAVRAGAITPEAAQAVASNARSTGNAADASGAIFAAVDSSTTGVTSEPTPNQAQQASPQPAQAPATQGLTNAATPQNNGAQAGPAQGAQGAAQTAVARPDGWRKSMLRAAPVAKAMGIDPTGKRLAQVVAEIDARDTQAPATPAPAPAPQPGPVRLGRNNTPLIEGGKPFKTRKAAGDAKKLQPMMRVVTVPGGYALAEKTPAQLAAEERASRRLRNPNTSARGEPIPAHAFIAAAGGLNRVAASDMGVDGNPRIGNRTLFAGQGRGLSMDQATQMLIQDGYLSEGATINDALSLIKTSLTRPQYNADGIERIAQAESDAQFEDYLAAQEEAAADGDTDPFGMADEFTAEELDEVGYTDADPALQAEVSALIAQAEAMDIDTFAILEDIARTYANATQDQYNAAARDALAQAIARGNQDGSGAASQAAPAAEPTAEQGLNQPEAPAALELAAQTPAEAAAQQDAQEQAAKAEAAAKRAADAAAKAEDERKRIAQASVRAADRFELGQDPMDSLTGQGNVFDAQEPEQQAPAATAAVAEQPITRADVTAAQQQAAAIITERIDAMTAGEVNTIARRFLPTMGVRPTVSKERNKAAVTDFTKVRPLAVADEFGVELPTDVRRALQADMEGRVTDAGRNGGASRKPDQTLQVQTPAWHSAIPEKGIAVAAGDEKLDGSSRVLSRIASEAAQAVTRAQEMANVRLYAYYLPGTAQEHGAVRLFPDDQTPPKPWTLLLPEGLPVGMLSKDALAAKIRDALRNAPVLTSGDEKKILAVQAQAKAQEPAQPISDAGQKIGGARKDRWKERGLNLDDLDAMTEAEGAELATKANVWKPDYDALSEASEPVTAAMVKTIYDQLAAKPKKNTPKGRRQYVQMMRIVRDVYTEANGPEAVKNAYLEIRKRAGLNTLDPKVKADGRELLFSVYKGRSDPFVFGFNELQRAKKLVADGFPAKADPWKTRLMVGRAEGGPGTTERGIEMYMELSAEVGTPLTREQILGGFYRVSTKDNKAVAFAASKADAEAAAATVYERDMKGKKDGKPEPVRPNLDELKRENLPRRIDRDVKADDFVNDLGFRGIEFGNWSAQDERQRILNMAYDGLMDLAEIMGVPPKAMSLNGTLGMAFGARGGGRFAAHYEPGKLVINMTKIRGGGSMAHEWAHAMDHYFGELDKPDAYTTQARGASGWYSEDQYLGVPRKRMERVGNEWKAVEKMRLDNLRPEMAAAFDEVMRALFSKQITKAEMVRSLELDLERTEALARNETQADLKAMYQNMVQNKQQALNEMRGDPEGTMYAGRGRTDYANQAQVLSGKSVDGYWLRPTEMFARAFESWVFDRVTAMGAKSDYLVHGVEEDRFAGGAYKGNPYPTGDERARINAAFDKLAQTIKTKETDKGVAMFSSADSTLPAKPLSLDRVNQLVQEALSGIRGAPPVEVTARPGDIGLRVPAGSVGYGVTLRSGDIYVFQSAMGSDLDVFKTVFHELFHRGVRVLVPKALYVQTMLDLAKGDSRIQQLAIEWKNTEMGQAQKDNLRKQGYTGAELTGQYEALAIEEALAAVAEEIKADGKLGSKPKNMTIRFLASWLAKLADLAGMKKLAQGIRNMSYNEAERFVMSAIDRSGDPVQAGRTDNLSAKPSADQAQALRELAAIARTAGNENKTVVLGRVSAQEVDLLQREGVSVDGEFTHAADMFAVRHALNRHGDAAVERSRGQIAITDDDVARIAEAVSAPTAYVLGGKTPRGQDVVGTIKRLDDGTLLYLEEVRSGRKTLAMTSMRKYPSTTDFEAIANSVLPSNARSDTGDVRIVYPDGSESQDAGIRFRSADLGGRAGMANLASKARDELANAAGAAIKSVTATHIKQRAGFKLTDYLGLGLQALGRRQIVDIYGDIVPLAEYNTLVAQMEADKNEGGAEADKLVKRWAELPDEGKLSDLMHEATLAQIDPAKPYVGGDDKAKYAMLAGRFNALSQEAKQVYTDTRDAYQAHHAKVRSAIKERIERSELKGPRKAELLKQMDDDFFAAVKGVYFPLARFGQYAVTVKGADGKVESVSRAETKAEAEALRNNLLSAFPRDKGFTVGRVMLSKDFIADRDAVGRGFMTELYQVLDKQDMDAAQRAELEDTLGQLYLSSLPDLSWAKHGIHRKGTPGFSQDARRAYAQNMFHGSRYLAKLRYSDLMQDELTAMQKHVDDWREVEDFDQNSAQRVVDEMNKRHESLMNPKSNPLSTALTSFGFIFHLGLSPASAMVNLSQTALVAYPIMGAKWGFGKASAALLKASAEATKGKNDITGSLNADERAAYDEAVRAGTIDVTMAHDLAGIAQGEDAGVMWKIRPVMRWASFLFHHAERFNRQVTFVASYRLAREAGADQKAAFEQATKATYDGHFDYGAANRPRVMQGNVAKVLLLFKQYGQNMVYTLSRNAYQSIKGTDAEKAEARKALAGLLTSHAMAAGVLGLPMVTTLLAAASMIGGDDDEPWDAQTALQNMLADAFGQKPAEVLARGLSRLTPWDISGRVGLDRLIFPDVQEGLEGQRLAESAMAAALGPVAGIGVNVLKGAQHMSEGRYALGLEAMLPSALRGPVKAIRYANEGVQDKSGISILDEVSPAAVAGQALGFSPSQARNAQEGKSAVMAHDRALGERRQELLTRAARASMTKDSEALDDARKEIARFNEKNPGRRINPNHIMQSVRNRNKRIDQAQDGVYLPKSRRDAMEAGRFALGD